MSSPLAEQHAKLWATRHHGLIRVLKSLARCEDGQVVDIDGILEALFPPPLAFFSSL